MSYTFRWAHPAKEVFVTGTFDNWSKSTQLDKKGDVFEKTVTLPQSSNKINYKFVADGKWIHDHTAKTETDHEGNLNNVLYPQDLNTASAAISSVAPGATTTALAGEEPLATPAPPGAFPETPMGLASDEDKTLSVNPIPATAGAGNPIKLAPGEKVPDPSTLTNNTISSTVHDDPDLKAADTARGAGQTASINPIPATGGAGNPIHLKPGEKVPDPSTITGNTVTSNVKLDEASYNNSDAGAPTLPPALSPTSEREAAGAPIFGLGPQTGTAIIPEAGLPLGNQAATDTENLGPTVSSAAPGSTTAQLAGAVPKEPRGVPSVVGESQHQAHAAPEASANPEAVVEKREVEQELKQKVPQEPATSESGVLGKSERGVVGAVTGGIAAAGAAAGAAIYSVAPNSTTAQLAGQVPKEPRGVPEVVGESQEQAHASPEASANPEAVREKSQVEQELKKAVHEQPATSESGLLGKSEGGVTAAIAGGVAAAGAAAAGTAYALRDQTKKTTGTDPVSVLPVSAQNKINQNQPAVTSATITDVAQDTGIPQQFHAGGPVQVPADSAAARQTTDRVPTEVTTSQKEAHVGPEASANPTAVREKEDVEQELLKKIKPAEGAGEPAPGHSAALAGTAPASTSKSTSGAPQLGNPVAGVAPLDLKDGLNASANSPAVPPTAKENVAPKSGDVSPLTNPNDEPTVTTGVASSSVPTESTPRSRPGANTTPQKRQSFVERLRGTPESSKDGASEDDGKKKRRSFFGKLKDKLKH